MRLKKKLKKKVQNSTTEVGMNTISNISEIFICRLAFHMPVLSLFLYLPVKLNLSYFDCSFIESIELEVNSFNKLIENSHRIFREFVILLQFIF